VALVAAIGLATVGSAALRGAAAWIAAGLAAA
jgi:hypothetical protein